MNLDYFAHIEIAIQLCRWYVVTMLVEDNFSGAMWHRYYTKMIRPRRCCISTFSGRRRPLPEVTWSLAVKVPTLCYAADVKGTRT